MDWLNLHTSVLDSPEFLGAEPLDRATWLCLLRYCIGQENGGTIRDCSDWGDRKWQQLCRITRKEATRTCDLWAWTGNDIEVRHYPVAKEEQIQRMRAMGAQTSDRKSAAARANGANGGRKKAQLQTEHGTQLEGELKTHGEPIERKGKERKGREAANPTGPDLSKPAREPDPAEVFTPSPDAPRPTPEQEFLYLAAEHWFQRLQSILGRKLAKSNWREWKRLADLFGIEETYAAIDKNDVDDRWPDGVEEALREKKRIRRPAIIAPNPVLEQANQIVDKLGWEKAKLRLSIAEMVTSDAYLRDVMQENPTMAAEMIAERA